MRLYWLAAIDVLKQLYTYCASLRVTVSSLAPQCELLKNEDDDNFTHFCHTIVVAAHTIPSGHYDVIQRRTQLEILHSVVEVDINIDIIVLTIISMI